MELGATVRASRRACCQVSMTSFLRDQKLMLCRFVEDRTYKLLVVDSIMNLFRKLRRRPITVTPADRTGQDYSGRGELSERQQVRPQLSSVRDEAQAESQKLNQFLARLQKLSEEFNIAVLLTNQVQADPGVGYSWSLCVHS